MTSLDTVATRLQQANNILLISHIAPDGDTLGSMLGLKIALTSVNKKVTCFCADQIPSIFSFLPQISSVKQEVLLGDFDLIVILDCGDCNRTGISDRIKELSKIKNKIVNIDHHPKNDLHKIAKYNYVDYTASSVAEIIYELIKLMRIKIDKDIALCLLCGLYTDTGSFKHSSTTPKTLKIASALLQKGARLKKITQNVIANHSIAALHLWGIALKRLKINRKYGIAVSTITRDDLQTCSASDDDVSGIVNMINTVPQAKIALFLFQKDAHTIKASIRTEDNNINLTKLAQLFGGGGHRKASGFAFAGKIIVEQNSFHIDFK